MSIETDTLPATAGAWTPSASVKILSASAESMNEGDLVQVYGSSLGTEPSATDGTLVGTVVKTPFGIVFRLEGVPVSPGELAERRERRRDPRQRVDGRRSRADALPKRL